MNSQAERAMGPLPGSKHISPARQRDSMILHLPRLVGVLPKTWENTRQKLIAITKISISILKRKMEEREGSRIGM